MLEPAGWTDTLRAVCDVVDGCSGVLQLLTPSTGAVKFSAEWGTDAAYSALYQTRYSTLNPLVRATPRPGSVSTLSDWIDPREFQRTRFYREWAEPQAYYDVLIGFVGLTPERPEAIAIARHERAGTFRTEHARALAALVPHVGRALSLSRALDDGRARDATLVLDRLSVVALLVNHRGHIQHANAAALATLADGQGIRDDRGQLRCATPKADMLLRAALEAPTATPVTIPIAHGRGRAVLTLVDAGRSGQRLVLLTRPDGAQLAIEPVAVSYGLTPAEAEVLRRLVEGRSLVDIAEMLSVRISTIRTHLRRLLHKTDSARQSDLVRLVMRLSPPLR